MSASPNQTPDAVLADRPINYNGIDLVKFLCAILVFLIHVPPFQYFLVEDVGLAEEINFGLRHCLCRVAVPFYFTCAGFFLFRKMPLYEPDPETVKRYCFKLLRLTGTWYLLLFLGDTEHLWYLKATVVAVTLVSLCFYFRIRLRYLGILAVLLYTVGLLGDAYYGYVAPLKNHKFFYLVFTCYEIAFKTTRNGVFMGFLFVLMGAGFAHRKIRIKPMAALAGFGVSLLCLFAEVFFLKNNDIPAEYNMYVFLIPAAFFLFSFAYTVRLKDRPVYGRLRKMGTVIYFSHLLIGNVVMWLVIGTQKFLGIGLQRYQFCISLISVLLFAFCVEWLSRREKLKWINWCLS